MQAHSNTTRGVLIAAMALGLSGCGMIDSLGFGSIFSTSQSPRDETVETRSANRFLYAAALDVLKFLPVTDADPVTGTITTGFGTPPGGRASYRAAIYVTSNALDASSLVVSLQSRSGPVAVETKRAIEDAILTRARQLFIADRGL